LTVWGGKVKGGRVGPFVEISVGVLLQQQVDQLVLGVVAETDGRRVQVKGRASQFFGFAAVEAAFWRGVQVGDVDDAEK